MEPCNAMGKLTTHVLDTAHGTPGAGIALSLFRCQGGGRQLLGHFKTNADGRCDAPLLVDAALLAGIYELDFSVGAYFAGLGVVSPAPAFLDVITLRFGVAESSAHYHVPLLVSPFGYSSYRGS
jgi:5-hydroxyisourate hydrolase